MSVPSPEIRRETEAALAARGELGPEYDDNCIQRLLDESFNLIVEAGYLERIQVFLGASRWHVPSRTPARLISASREK